MISVKFSDVTSETQFYERSHNTLNKSYMSAVCDDTEG